MLQRLRGDLPVMLELTDPAPVDLREPVRGLLWITGQLSAVDPVRARRIALGLAERHPQPALLELGHGATMVRLTPGSVVLSDAEGSAALGRHLPGPLHDLREVRIRPLGVDRCGLRLRVEVGDRDHDVRLAWEHPISTADELRPQLQRLVGCPHRPS